MNESDILEKGLTQLRLLCDNHGYFNEPARLSPVHGPWDAFMDLESGERLGIVVNTSLYPLHIEKLLSDIHRQNSLPPHDAVVPLVITVHVSEPAFELCIKNNLNVLDLDGNVFLAFKGLWLERYRPRIVSERPRVAGSPFTARGVRIVRALLADPRRCWRQKELVEATEMSPGYVSQMIRRLATDGLIRSSVDIRPADPDRLLDEWVSHYRFDRHRKLQFAANFASYGGGLEKVAGELKRLGIPFAFTGWSGAFLRAPYGIPPVVMAYVAKPIDAAVLTSLFPVERDGNVLLYQPQDAGVLQFANQVNGLPVVGDAQLYADLSKMPGRAREQAEILRQKCLQREVD
jgi:hypothetical protein